MEERGPVDGFGAWYDAKQGDTGDVWHRTLIDPALFARIGTLPAGVRVLDLGCGNGYIARRLARRGAKVVGVDRSHELIGSARRREEGEPLGVVYHETDAADLSMLRNATFDLAIANMSLIDIENASGAIRETGRVVAPGGRFVFSLSHPCFDVDTRSDFVVETVGGRPTVFRKVAGYREPHSDTYRWAGSQDPPIRTVGYHRPLGWYVKELRSAGFVIVDLEEPAPLEGFTSQRYEPEWIRQVPLHLIVEARRDPVTGTRP